MSKDVIVDQVRRVRDKLVKKMAAWMAGSSTYKKWSAFASRVRAPEANGAARLLFVTQIEFCSSAGEQTTFKEHTAPFRMSHSLPPVRQDVPNVIKHRFHRRVRRVAARPFPRCMAEALQDFRTHLGIS